MSNTPRHHSKPKTVPLRHLIADARRLVARYRSRNDPALALSAEQRKAWAWQATGVLTAFIDECERSLGPHCGRFDRNIEMKTWDLAFGRGQRIAKPIPQEKTP